MAFDPNQIDSFISSAADGFTQIYTAVNPPPQPVVRPIVYTTVASDGSTQAGLDLGSVLLVGAVIVGLWYLLKR